MPPSKPIASLAPNQFVVLYLLSPGNKADAPFDQDSINSLFWGKYQLRFHVASIPGGSANDLVLTSVD